MYTAMQERTARLKTRDDRIVLCGHPACHTRLGTVVRGYRTSRGEPVYDDDPVLGNVRLGRGWKRNQFGVYVRGNHALKRIRQGLEPKDRRHGYTFEGDELVAVPVVTEISMFPARVRCVSCNAINVLDVQALRLVR